MAASRASLSETSCTLTAAYIMLRDGVEYQDLGNRFFTERDKAETTKRLLRRLRNLGLEVEVKPAAA